MNVTRTVNGKAVSVNELKDFTISNKTVLDIVERARLRGAGKMK